MSTPQTSLTKGIRVYKLVCLGDGGVGKSGKNFTMIYLTYVGTCYYEVKWLRTYVEWKIWRSHGPVWLKLAPVIMSIPPVPGRTPPPPPPTYAYSTLGV